MSEKIYIGIDNKKIEAKGDDLKYLLEAQAAALEEQNRILDKLKTQEDLKQSAIAKLAKLGLTEDEAKAIIGIQ